MYSSSGRKPYMDRLDPQLRYTGEMGQSPGFDIPDLPGNGLVNQPVPQPADEDPPFVLSRPTVDAMTVKSLAWGFFLGRMGVTTLAIALGALAWETVEPSIRERAPSLFPERPSSRAGSAMDLIASLIGNELAKRTAK